MSQLIIESVSTLVLYYVLTGITFASILGILHYYSNVERFRVLEFLITVLLWSYILVKMVNYAQGAPIEEEVLEQLYSKEDVD